MTGKEQMFNIRRHLTGTVDKTRSAACTVVHGVAQRVCGRPAPPCHQTETPLPKPTEFTTSHTETRSNSSLHVDHRSSPASAVGSVCQSVCSK